MCSEITLLLIHIRKDCNTINSPIGSGLWTFATSKDLQMRCRLVGNIFTLAKRRRVNTSTSHRSTWSSGTFLVRALSAALGAVARLYHRLYICMYGGRVTHNERNLPQNLECSYRNIILMYYTIFYLFCFHKTAFIFRYLTLTLSSFCFYIFRV